MKKKIILEVISIALGVVIATLNPVGDLTVEAMIGLGIFVWAIANLIFQIFADYAIALAMCSLWALTKVVPFTVAFSAFSGTTFWMLLAALGIGVALSYSGRLNRITLTGLTLFPPSFNGQVAALVGVGTFIVGPMIPSTTAKNAIAAPIGISIGESLGFEKQSRSMAGMLMATQAGFASAGPVFVSASFFGYTMLGLLPDGMAARFDFLHWFFYMIPWTLIVTIGTYLFIIKFYKPKQKSELSKAYFSEQLKAMGKMSRDEKISGIVLIGCLAFWITESIHGIPSVVVCALGLFVLMCANVINKNDVKTQFNWPLLLFLGCVVSLTGVFSKLGIDQWLGGIIVNFVTSVSTNIYVAIILIAITVYVARFLICSMTTALTLLTALLVPIATTLNFNPWIVGITVYASLMIWITSYQNVTFMAGYATAGGAEMVRYKDTVPMSVVYMILSIVGLIASIPFWSMCGLVG